MTGRALNLPCQHVAQLEDLSRKIQRVIGHNYIRIERPASLRCAPSFDAVYCRRSLEAFVEPLVSATFVPLGSDVSSLNMLSQTRDPRNQFFLERICADLLSETSSYISDLRITRKASRISQIGFPCLKVLCTST